MWRRLVQAIKRLLSPHTPEMIVVVVVGALLFRTILFNTQQLQLSLILQRTLEDMTRYVSFLDQIRYHSVYFYGFCILYEWMARR